MRTKIPSDLLKYLRTCQRAAALTGSGISQESGLHTFRDPQDGLWEQYRPEDLATAEAFLRNPRLVWDWYTRRREKVLETEPNPGHQALVAMSFHMPRFTLITQNVDGLHQKAGSHNVIELHGNIRQVKCFDCGRIVHAWQDNGGEVPHCPSCNGMLRPDVVWFGENLPAQALHAAEQAVSSCQVFFSIGTSGLVHPAASLAYAALRQGARVVEVNTEETPLTPHIHYFLRGKSGEILPALVSAVWDR